MTGYKCGTITFTTMKDLGFGGHRLLGRPFLNIIVRQLTGSPVSFSKLSVVCNHPWVEKEQRTPVRSGVERGAGILVNTSSNVDVSENTVKGLP